MQTSLGRVRLPVHGCDVQLERNGAMFQSDGPARSLAAINEHYDLSVRRRQLEGFSESHEVWTDLGEWVRSAFDNQKELDLR